MYSKFHKNFFDSFSKVNKILYALKDIGFIRLQKRIRFQIRRIIDNIFIIN